MLIVIAASRLRNIGDDGSLYWGLQVYRAAISIYYSGLLTAAPFARLSFQIKRSGVGAHLVGSLYSWDAGELQIHVLPA